MAKKENKSFIQKIVGNAYVKTALLMLLAVCVLVVLILFGLSTYTRHGESVAVPPVGGMQIEEASAILKKASLGYEIVDSIFLTDGVPGAIIDQLPDENSLVKKDRVIYLTVQAKSVEMITLPVLKDFSQRQAVATLNSLGFMNVVVREVPSAYRGLVVDVLHKGKSVDANARVPKGDPITLSVGAGGEVIIDSLIDIIPYIDPEDIIQDSSEPASTSDATPAQAPAVTPAPEVDKSFFD